MDHSIQPAYRSKWSRAMLRLYRHCEPKFDENFGKNDHGHFSFQDDYQYEYDPKPAEVNTGFVRSDLVPISLSDTICFDTSDGTNKVSEPICSNNNSGNGTQMSENKDKEPLMFISQSTIDNINLKLNQLFIKVDNLNKFFNTILEHLASKQSDGCETGGKLSREQLLQLRSNFHSKMYPQGLDPKHEVVLKKSNNYDVIDFTDPQMPKYRKLNDKFLLRLP